MIRIDLHTGNLLLPTGAIAVPGSVVAVNPNRHGDGVNVTLQHGTSASYLHVPIETAEHGRILCRLLCPYVGAASAVQRGVQTPLDLLPDALALQPLEPFPLMEMVLHNPGRMVQLLEWDIPAVLASVPLGARVQQLYLLHDCLPAPAADVWLGSHGGVIDAMSSAVRHRSATVHPDLGAAYTQLYMALCHPKAAATVLRIFRTMHH